MNIENHIHNAKKSLDLARDKVDRQDYESALAILCIVMTETRELLEHVFALHSLQSECSVSAEENAR